LFGDAKTVPAKADGDLSKVALGWMAEMVRGEFESALAFDGQPSRFNLESAADAAVWQREWKRRWRRLQLPDQLTEYSEELEQARTTQDVYSVLSEHVIRIVGGYTCLVFLRQSDSSVIRPIPDARVGADVNRLRLRSAPPFSGLIGPADLSPGRDSTFTPLAPLFINERAVCLAHAPFANGGMILLVERRQKRAWEAEDWYLLRALTVQAEAALERVRLYSRVRGLSDTDPVTGLANGSHLDALLEHAWCSVLQGEALSVISVSLDRRHTSDLRTVAEVLRQEARDRGVTVRDGDCSFVIVMPQADRSAASRVMERVQGRLGPVFTLRTGMAQYESSMQSPQALVAAARREHDTEQSVLE
jgi:GGDEF domain-containing protein